MVPLTRSGILGPVPKRPALTTLSARAAARFSRVAVHLPARFSRVAPRLPALLTRIAAFFSARRLRRLITVGALGMAVAVAVVLGCSQWIRSAADGHIYDAASVPAAPVALVLGAQVGADGQPSAFLAARLEIARQLLAAGKVKAILVSGDHGRWAYDEPGAMQNWLVANGVPADRVALDHAGFDTYDSCSRANKIFGVREAIVVTQDFHLPRAVTLCREQGIEATGVGDSSVRVFKQMWVRGEVREYGAAVKAAADVLTARDPIFLGRYETSVDQAVSLS
ncbi:protein SanA, affects membrane permeability for vancomycin [Actinoplanes derwentensis]|uniref:Protein SanA, affects membrane permeability for vancomycin n=1 Tax=Actinoplanes derwentensis TaxID=113562 RepID=A0A1H2DAJ4_9ACTN|nr:protein SanA, affects membrane permeability for vancomycin [Actinoplanes derwentensis]